MTQSEKAFQKEMQLYYQKARSEGKRKREAKKFARVMASGYKVPFSNLEQRFIDEHPEYQGRVSEGCYLVKKFAGFRVDENDMGLVRTQYEEVEEPLVFLNIKFNEARESFGEAGNADEYEEMMNYANKHPEYMERFFDNKMEEECEKTDREQEAQEAKKKEEEAKEVAEKLELIAESVQLQKLMLLNLKNKSCPEKITPRSLQETSTTPNQMNPQHQ